MRCGLPPNFVNIRFHGYFLNTVDMCLYSIKQNGTLRQLKHYNKSLWRHSSGYTISQDGESRNVTDGYLASIVQNSQDYTIPVTHRYYE